MQVTHSEYGVLKVRRPHPHTVHTSLEKYKAQPDSFSSSYSESWPASVVPGQLLTCMLEPRVSDGSVYSR